MPEQVSLAELVAFVSLTIERFSEVCTRGLRCDIGQRRDLIAMLLMYSVLDYARAVIVLANARAFAGIPVVARSALEAYVDICALCDHADYWRSLVAVDATKLKTVMQRASAGWHPSLEPMRVDPVLPEARRRYSRELKQLEADGVKTYNVEERFALAGLTGEQGSIYALLSAETHNNVSGLESRYLDYDDTTKWLVRPGETSSHVHEYELPCTLTTGEIVLRSAEKVLRLFGHGIAALGPGFKELDRLWARAQAEEARNAGRDA